MLADDQHAVDRQLVAAQRQGLGDRGIDLQVLEPGVALAAQVALGELVDVHRDQIELRPIVLALPAEAFENAIEDHLGVRSLRNSVSRAATLGRWTLISGAAA